jgi:hypothetical protein
VSDDRDNPPCIRGCKWDTAIEGEEPRPKAANHGNLCDSCFYRMKYALKMIPDLMANMRLNIVPPSPGSYAPAGPHIKPEGSPAPLKINALDSSDALFAKLVSWIDSLSETLKTTAPSIRVWMGFSEVQGSRPVSAVAAHDQAAQLTAWFLVRLDQIAASTSAVAFHDDIAWGWDESPGVYKLTGQYGIEPRPMRTAEKRECPICGQREVFVKPPDALDPDVAVICGRCKWVADPETTGSVLARLVG